MDNGEQFNKLVKSTTNIVHNKKRYVTLQDKIALMSGVVTGILQCESTTGFLIFLVTYLSSCLVYVGWMCGFQPGEFYDNVLNDMIFEIFMRELLGFVMAWTFSFALIN